MCLSKLVITNNQMESTHILKHFKSMTGFERVFKNYVRYVLHEESNNQGYILRSLIGYRGLLNETLTSK